MRSERPFRSVPGGSDWRAFRPEPLRPLCNGDCEQLRFRERPACHRDAMRSCSDRPSLSGAPGTGGRDCSAARLEPASKSARFDFPFGFARLQFIVGPSCIHWILSTGKPRGRLGGKVEPARPGAAMSPTDALCRLQSCAAVPIGIGYGRGASGCSPGFGFCATTPTEAGASPSAQAAGGLLGPPITKEEAQRTPDAASPAHEG